MFWMWLTDLVVVSSRERFVPYPIWMYPRVSGEKLLGYFEEI